MYGCRWRIILLLGIQWEYHVADIEEIEKYYY